MLNITENTKIYVYCPAGVVTGGVELLHQLVDILNKCGRDAYVCYLGDKPHECPSEYSSYNLKFASSVEDEACNIAVYFDSGFSQAFELKNIQKVLWWMSVDNLFRNECLKLSFTDMYLFDKKFAIVSFLRKAKQLLKGRNIFRKGFSIQGLIGLDIVAAYQSEYARDFLEKKGFKKIAPLKDYINTEHRLQGDNVTNRESRVLYNPKKGFEYTKQLMKIAPELNWIPIQNMTRNELISLMRTSKLYIDFGNHPGKDRLPREAALNGCCIITGRRGSANFYGDIAIPNKYKFDESIADKSRVVETIEDVVNNYETVIHDFDDYVSNILKEENEFYNQVYDLFQITANEISC